MVNDRGLFAVVGFFLHSVGLCFVGGLFSCGISKDSEFRRIVCRWLSFRCWLLHCFALLWIKKELILSMLSKINTVCGAGFITSYNITTCVTCFNLSGAGIIFLRWDLRCAWKNFSFHPSGGPVRPILFSINCIGGAPFVIL